MKGLTIGFALCGSFCTIKSAVEQIPVLLDKGARVVPIMSKIVYETDTRFGTAEQLKCRIEEITGEKIIHTVPQAEPIGPKKLLDVLVVAPCTGNTLAKLANAITDSSVTMAVKAHLRNNRPVVLCIASNDALSGSAINIGKLLNTKNIYFVPFGQDDAINKTTSLISDFDLIPKAVTAALNGQQLQPILLKE